MPARLDTAVNVSAHDALDPGLTGDDGAQARRARCLERDLIHAADAGHDRRVVQEYEHRAPRHLLQCGLEPCELRRLERASRLARDRRVERDQAELVAVDRIIDRPVSRFQHEERSNPQSASQLLGAIVVLLLGLKAASWCGSRLARLAESKGVDVTLSRFLGNVTRLTIVAAVVVITLGNFGITIAPLIAIAGASAFGATLAIQGPLSNYGAGLAIVLARPFVVGDTITVKGTSGGVELITLGYTRHVCEDAERITVPNKEIVGEMIVNSKGRRVVEASVLLAAEADVGRAVALARETFARFPELGGEPRPQVGIHDFTYGGVILGLRYWVPSRRYFELRYQVNGAIHAAFEVAGIPRLSPAAAALDREAAGIGG